jgi:hypothetical protein
MHETQAPAGNGASRSRTWAHWLGRNWARLSHGRAFEPTWLELTRHQVAVRHLAPEAGGYCIVHLSDLHCGRSVPLHYLRRVVALANEQGPDLIAVTGDFIHKGYRYVDRAARIVGELRARHGVFAVLGNHDFAVRNALGLRTRLRLHHAVENALRAEGVRVLRNEAQVLPVAGGALQIVGVDDLWSGACDLSRAFAALTPDVPRILLAHNPQTVERLHASQFCDLILSGHTHGGQIVWPGRGPILLGREARRLAAGMYRHPRGLVYVNRGVGHGLRFRLGVRPELAVLRLHALRDLPNAPIHPSNRTPPG